MNAPIHRLAIAFLVLVCLQPTEPVAAAPTGLDTAAVDTAAREVLQATRVPGIALAVVQGGRIAYRQAYGNARLQPPVAASPERRHAIGSVSKQFLAVALLMLQEEGRLSLDDTVAKYFPELTRAEEVSVRQLLSHTSGYQDFWPQDYVPADMRLGTTPAAIAARWAKKPLDFEPGTRWQYSNTGYTIAAMIFEKAAGEPLFAFLQRRVFGPLGMRSVQDLDSQPLQAPDPAGYSAFGLGPARESVRTGPGWLFGAGQLGMTPEDLARWDIALMESRLLRPESVRQLVTETLLADGAGSGYGLGIDVELVDGRRKLGHGGEVSGFCTQNTVYPDHGIAYVIFVNQDATEATDLLADKLDHILFVAGSAEDTARLAQARDILLGLQQGRIDRARFSANGNAYFSAQALEDFRGGLAPLGELKHLEQLRYRLRGGMVNRVFEADFASRKLRVWTYQLPDGTLEQYMVAPLE